MPIEAVDKFGCDQCGAEDPEVAAKRASLAPVAELLEESHFGLNLLVCQACGQAWLSVFMEMIDWVNGDDPQYISLLPLTPSEQQQLTASSDQVNTQFIEQLGEGRRYLQIDHPSGQPRRVSWSSGRLLIIHD